MNASESWAALVVEWSIERERAQRTREIETDGRIELDVFLSIRDVLRTLRLLQPSADADLEQLGHVNTVAAACAVARLVEDDIASGDEAVGAAICAAERWLRCPCRDHALGAEPELMAAVRHVWVAGAPPEENREGWAYRITHWAASAPRYRWPAFAAIEGATKTRAPQVVTHAIAQYIGERQWEKRGASIA